MKFARYDVENTWNGLSEAKKYTLVEYTSTEAGDTNVLHIVPLITLGWYSRDCMDHSTSRASVHLCGTAVSQALGREGDENRTLPGKAPAP